MNPVLALIRAMMVPFLGQAKADSLRNLDIAVADFKRLGLSLGNRYEANILGMKFVVRCVRARAAITSGSILKGYASAASRLANVIAPFDAAVINTDGVFTAHDFVWPGVSAIVEVVAGTGGNQWRPILNNDAAKLIVAKRDSQARIDANQTPDALQTALDATSDVAIYADWEVVPTAGASDLIVGGALGDVTSGNFTLMIERGIAPVRLDGSNAGQAATSLGLIVPSATAGVARGITTAGITAAEAAYAFGKSIHAYSGAAAKRLCQFSGRYAA